MLGFDSIREIWYWYFVVQDETIVSTDWYATVLRLIIGGFRWVIIVTYIWMQLCTRLGIV